MEDRDITCANCGSNFRLAFERDEVSYEPENCPFCGDLVGPTRRELDFMTDDPAPDYDEYSTEWDEADR